MLEAYPLALLIPDDVRAEPRGSREATQFRDRVASEQGERGTVGVFQLAFLVADGDRLGERIEERSAPLNPLC
jgi:hypothetical protein